MGVEDMDGQSFPPVPKIDYTPAGIAELMESVGLDPTSPQDRKAALTELNITAAQFPEFFEGVN
jgi:hypothetical protein